MIILDYYLKKSEKPVLFAKKGSFLRGWGNLVYDVACVMTNGIMLHNDGYR